MAVMSRLTHMYLVLYPPPFIFSFSKSISWKNTLENDVSYDRAAQTGRSLDSLGILFTCRLRLGLEPEICISNKLPGKAGAVGPGAII